VFSVSTSPIELLPKDSAASTSGAVVTFEGTVRDHNDGRRVESLEYEAMESLACNEGNRIIDEARDKFPILSASCVHRVGHLNIGDIAIRVMAVSAHRADAFEACQYIVHEVKSRVPIWKKEHYVDGSTEWIGSTNT
jgi:molybdopterin synthase catalytic subunit